MDWQDPKDAIADIRRADQNYDGPLGDRLCREAAERFPDSPEILAAYGRSLWALGKGEECESVMRRALEIGPECAVAWAAKAEIDIFEARMESALHAARKAVSLDLTDPWVLFWSADAFIGSRETQTSLELVERWRELYPEDIVAWAEGFNFLYGGGKQAEAVQLLEEAGRRFPDAPVFWRLRARILQRTDLPAAIELFRKTTERQPGSSMAWAEYAAALSFAGQNAEAERAAMKALEICPLLVNGMEVMERICIGRGRRAEAKQWRKSIESIPFTAFSKALGPASEAMRKSRWRQAIRLVEPAMSSPMPIIVTGALQFKTKALVELGRFDEAEASFEKLETLDSIGPDYYELKGRILHARGDRDGAIEMYRKGLDKHPYEGTLRYRLIKLLWARGAKHQVEMVVADTFNYIPESPWGLQWAALALTETGYKDEACRLWEIGQSRFPGLGEFHVLKALDSMDRADFRGFWGALKDWWYSRKP